MFGLGRKKTESELVYIEVCCYEKSTIPGRVAAVGWWTFRVHGEDFTVVPDDCSELSAEDASARGITLCERLGLRVSVVEISPAEETDSLLD
jgi:hypothetical protein